MPEERLAFVDKLCEGYEEIMPGEPALFKMKEVWSYLCGSLPEGGKLWKRIKKARMLSEYKNIIHSL